MSLLLQPPPYEGRGFQVCLHITCKLSVSTPSIAHKLLPAHNVPQFQGSKRVVVEIQVTGAWSVAGTTEQNADQQSLEFAAGIEIYYLFESIQPVRLRLIDTLLNAVQGPVEVAIASFETTLGAIIASPNGKAILPGPSGEMTIVAEEARPDGGRYIDLVLTARDLAVQSRNVLDLLTGPPKSNPYYVLSRIRLDGSRITVFKSATVENSTNPTWPLVHERVSLLGPGVDEKIVLSVHNNNRMDDHLIGEVEIPSTLSPDLIGNEFTLMKKGKPQGVVRVTSLAIVRPTTFLDYLYNGVVISVMFSIDMTQSNLDYRKPDSLHFLDPDGQYQNPYMRAIASVGSVLEAYDPTRKIPAWAFGFRLPNGQLTHLFPLSARHEEPEVDGVAGILSAYKLLLPKIELYGPTNFAPTIRRATEIAIRNDTNARARGLWGQYSILVILTDGEITDLEETRQAVIDCAFQPISIVIVGLGFTEFVRMRELAGENGGFRVGNIVPVRVNVSFILHRLVDGQPHLIAQETLRQIPNQVIQYFQISGRSINFPV